MFFILIIIILIIIAELGPTGKYVVYVASFFTVCIILYRLFLEVKLICFDQYVGVEVVVLRWGPLIPPSQSCSGAEPLYNSSSAPRTIKVSTSHVVESDPTQVIHEGAGGDSRKGCADIKTTNDGIKLM